MLSKVEQWLALKFRMKVSSYLRVVNRVYVYLAVAVLTETQTHYVSLQAPIDYPLSY